MSERLNRRDFLRLAAMSTTGVVLGRCGINLNPEQPAPTRIPWKHIPPEVTPESQELIEKIDIGISGLSVERYGSVFKDVTSEMPKEYLDSISETLADDSLTRTEFENNHLFVSKAEPSVYFEEEGEGFIYFNGRSQRFFKHDTQEDDQISPETRQKTSWPSGISSDGKILYERYIPNPSKDANQVSPIYVLADIAGSSKTFIRDTRKQSMVEYQVEHHGGGGMSEWSYKEHKREPVPFNVKLCADGNRLLISFFEDTERKSYLVDLNNRNTQPLNFDNRVRYDTYNAKIVGQNTDLIPNHDGSLIYVSHADALSIPSKGHGAIYNDKGNLVRPIKWPFVVSASRRSTISPDFRYISRGIHHSRFGLDSNGALQTEVCTPEGFFLVDGENKNVYPGEIYNNGNLSVRVDGRFIGAAFLIKTDSGYRVSDATNDEARALIIKKE